eukprot:m.124332 g.124332  ORF g.124332 m.124332 type:complete len:64 (+) comp37846_c0_seq16:26-217(+)
MRLTTGRFQKLTILKTSDLLSLNCQLAFPHLVAKADLSLGSSTYRPYWIQLCHNENAGNCDAE